MCDRIGLVMKKITKSALLISVLISAGVAFSADTFKNSILDMSMKKELNNTVSLTIFTSKPYNENLFITKRNATTYVILFPETDTKLKSEISKAATEGLVQKVDVKTQPYNDQNGKGYTKVVLTTPENTTVLAKTEVYNPEAPAKKVAQTLPPVIKENAPQEAKPAVTEKSAQVQPKAEPKTEPKKQAEQAKFDIIKPENLPKTDTNNKVTVPPNLPKEEVKNEVEEQGVQREEQTEKVEEGMPLQEADKQELPPPPQKVKKEKSGLVLFFESKVFWGSAGAIVLLMLLGLFLNAKRKLKEIIGEDGVDLDLEKVKARKQEMAEPVKVETVDDETESKVNLYRLLNSSEEGEESQETEEVTDTYSDDLANLLDVEGVDNTILESNKEENFDNVQEIVNDVQNNEVETEFVLDDIVIDDSEDERQKDDLFELNTENQPEEEKVPESPIDDYMKYLADNPEKLEVNDLSLSEENNSAEVSDVTLPEMVEPETVEFADEEVEYTEPEVLPVVEAEETTEPEFALVDMSEEETRMIEEEQNKLQDMYVDAAANDDEIQNIETIDFEEHETDVAPAEFEQTDVNSLFEREDFASDIMQSTDIPNDMQLQDYSEASDNEPIFGDENNVLDLTDYKQTVKVHQPVDKEEEDVVSDEAIIDYIGEHETEEKEANSVVLENGLKVISQVQIKKNAGLYMVDYEGTHALIGFKNDDYYVLKNFEEAPKKELQARLYDKNGRKEQYLVKLGREKMIVEFNQKEIKHVMDL